MLSESESEREGLGRQIGQGLLGRRFEGFFYGGSAPELGPVEGDRIKARTVFSGDAAKFGQVAGGVVAVGGHKGAKEGGYFVLGHSVKKIAHKKSKEPFTMFLLNGDGGDPRSVDVGCGFGH